MASINMRIRTDSKLKDQTEQVLSPLGMNMTGTINMFLQQIVYGNTVADRYAGYHTLHL